MKIRISLALIAASLLSGGTMAGCSSEKPKDTAADIKEFKGSAPPPEVQKMIAEKMRQGGQAAPVGAAPPASSPK